MDPTTEDDDDDDDDEEDRRIMGVVSSSWPLFLVRFAMAYAS